MRDARDLDVTTVSARQRTVWVVDDGRKWLFAGRRRPISDYGDPVAHPDDLAKCTATDLRAALVRSTSRFGSSGELHVSEGSPPDADVEDGTAGPVSFTLADSGDLLMRVIHATSPHIDDDDDLFEHVGRTLTPLLDRNRMLLVSAENQGGVGGGDQCVIEIDIGFNTRGRIVADLLTIGLDALVLLEAVDSGSFGRKQVADLLRSGHADALVGQAEGRGWRPNDSTTTSGQCRARFLLRRRWLDLPTLGKAASSSSDWRPERRWRATT